MRTPIRVLIVEDSEDDAALLLLLLRQDGFQVYSERVDSPDTMAAALNKKWDIVISDHTMPHFSGSDALKMVRLCEPDVPFLFVSGTIGEDAAVEAMRAGAQDYVMKSNLKRLIPAIRREIQDAENRTERKRLEQSVQGLLRFEAIGRLVGGIAHDFNNMIGAILGWAEMGYEESRSLSVLNTRFEKIRDQSLRAGRLTSQLLAFAGGQILQPRSVDLNTIVEQERSLLAPVIGDDIAIRVIAAPDLRHTLADPSQLEQVLMNLCLNARDAIVGGGQITIETQNVEISAKFCRDHACGSPGSYIVLSVSDTGTGMNVATLERIFEPFFTTKEVGKGTGLGLATVYGVVKQHGGFVHVDSEPGKGTSFRVYLPAESGEQGPSEAINQDHPLRGTETILLVEDHEGLRDTAQEMLQRLGYQVIAASDGKEALELFKAASNRIDLLVTDVIMPLMSGPEAYLAMSAISPELRVVFTTGYTPEAKALVALVAKGASLVQKPYSLTTLSQMIRAALETAADITAGVRRPG
jgi:two-component system, cell cycle sensor histidine kinase and response regulator CckA